MGLDIVFPHPVFAPRCARKQEKDLQNTADRWSSPFFPWQLSPLRHFKECDGSSASWGLWPPACEQGRCSRSALHWASKGSPGGSRVFFIWAARAQHLNAWKCSSPDVS